MYGPSFEHVIERAEANRTIEGTVREAGNGKPVAGATVQAFWKKNPSSAQSRPCTTTPGMRRQIAARKATKNIHRVRPMVQLAEAARLRPSAGPIRTEASCKRWVIAGTALPGAADTLGLCLAPTVTGPRERKLKPPWPGSRSPLPGPSVHSGLAM